MISRMRLPASSQLCERTSPSTATSMTTRRSLPYSRSACSAQHLTHRAGKRSNNTERRWESRQSNWISGPTDFKTKSITSSERTLQEPRLSQAKGPTAAFELPTCAPSFASAGRSESNSRDLRDRLISAPDQLHRPVAAAQLGHMQT